MVSMGVNSDITGSRHKRQKRESGVNSKYIKPVLKWVGGKTQIMDTVSSCFPDHIVDYYEPFVGGGSVLLNLLERVRNKQVFVSGGVFAFDANEALIEMYKNIQRDPDELFNYIEQYSLEYASCSGTTVNRKAVSKEECDSPESYFYWARGHMNALKFQGLVNTMEFSALFIFINKTCFRGMYREGPNGFNVPFGHYKSPSIATREHLRTVSELIRDVHFCCRDFREVVCIPTVGDFMYLDPPYDAEKSTSFVGYTAGGFSKDSHNSLFESLLKMQLRGVSFLMSNSSTETVREYFCDPTRFTISELVCRRAIHSKDPGAMATELLIQPVL